MVDYYPKYYAMLSNNKRYYRASHSENEDFCRARHELASRGAEELFATLVVVTVDSPLFTKTVMRSCYKPGEILYNARWERTSPEGRRIWKAKLSEQGTKCREEKAFLY